ncbi:MAG: hypothetical protein ACYC4R_10010 [Anaerolineae bacterium]
MASSVLPSLHENLISQIPVLRLLMAQGYQYLTPAEALALRGAREREGGVRAIRVHGRVTR